MCILSRAGVGLVEIGRKVLNCVDYRHYVPL